MTEGMKLIVIYDLLVEVDNLLVRRFFDMDSIKMLDKKIEVLTQLKSGIPIGSINGFYDILELYPKDKNAIWD